MQCIGMKLETIGHLNSMEEERKRKKNSVQFLIPFTTSLYAVRVVRIDPVMFLKRVSIFILLCLSALAVCVSLRPYYSQFRLSFTHTSYSIT